MTTKVPRHKYIRPLENYTNMTDADLAARAMAVLNAMTGNSNFQNLPVDLAAFKTDINSLSVLISEARDGSKTVIARKNKQREVVIKSLKLLARFVEVHSNGVEAIFKSSGFEPRSATKTPTAPLPLPIIRMNTQLKTDLDELNIAKKVVFPEPGYAATSKQLRAQCDAILEACAPQPNSGVVMVVEEIVDALSGLIDLSSELKLLSRELESAARRRTTSKRLEFAGRLGRLNKESVDGLEFILGLLLNLVEDNV